MVPQVDPGQQAPRLDTATGRLSGAGWFPGVDGAPPFTFVRWKPQATATLNHYVPDFGGSHDLKASYEFQIDSSQFGANANSGHIRYLDDSANGRPFNVDRIMLFSVPAEGEIASDNHNRHHAVFIQDTWRPTGRLSLNLGVRYEQQRTYFLDAVSDPFLVDFFPAGTTAGRANVVWNTWAPRLGLTFALAPRTVLKGHYGRYYLNLADAPRMPTRPASPGLGTFSSTRTRTASTTARPSWARGSRNRARSARRSVAKGRRWTPTWPRNTSTRSASRWSTRWRRIRPYGSHMCART